MKRPHVHIAVEDRGRSIHFYSTLFGVEPTVVKPDYARWMLEDPRVNLAISSGQRPHRGIEHLGIQVESEVELADVYSRLAAANRPVLDEGRTTCCYAKSTKSWVSDPDGILWEAFHTDGDSTVYGSSPSFDTLAPAATTALDKAANCCAPE
jgi:catechol 2,3-dioxygenase-like lactoylglutathione lyase family enzyme